MLAATCSQSRPLFPSLDGEPANDVDPRPWAELVALTKLRRKHPGPQ